METSGAWQSGWWPRATLLAALLLATAVTATPTVAQTATAPTAVPTAATTPSPANDVGAAEETDGITQTEVTLFDGGGGGGNTVVQLRNTQDGRLRIRGKVDLNRIHGPRVEPRNLASAVASCTDCQTIAVALQLSLYERTATWVTPENAAVAVNIECTRCYTVARAIQYVLPVDDLNETPSDVAELIREMDLELREIHTDRTISLAEAEARIDDVIARFTVLGSNLSQERQEATESTSLTPTPTATPTVSPLPTGSPTSGSEASAPSTTTVQPTETPTSAPAHTLTSTATASPTPLP